MSEQAERFHWGWVVSSAAAGLGLIVTAYLGDLAFRWSQVTTGLLINLGSAFLLAFVLFLIERRFTRRVVDRVTSAAEAAVEAQTRIFGDRLDDLEERLNARRADDQFAQDQAIDSIADSVTFETISTALEEAERVAAIRGGLTVPGSRAGPPLAVKFEFAAHNIVRGDGVVIDDGRVTRLTVDVNAQRRDDDRRRTFFQVEWESGMAIDDVGASLETELRRGDRPMEAKAFDVVFALRELQVGLKLALADQRAPLGSEQLDGALIETLGDGWVITAGGLANVISGRRFSNAELGLDRPFGHSASGYAPDAPADVDSERWAYIMNRATWRPAKVRIR